MSRVLEQGQLKGAFEGFNKQDTLFEFSGGGKWRQAEYKYLYHYAYMPRAEVIQDDSGRIELRVDGLEESVLVR